VGDHGRKTGETNTVGKSKESRDTEGTLLVVLGHVDGTILEDILGGVSVTLGGEEFGGEDGETLGLPEVGVVGNGDHDPSDDEETNGNVDLSPPRNDQRRTQEGNNVVPVERDGTNTETASTTDLGENVVLGVDPANPGNGGDDREKETRDPLVEEHGNGGNTEELETGPLARLKLLILVKGVEQGDLDQVGGPDHGSGVDEVATKDTSHTVTQHLGSENEEEVGKETIVLLVPDLLDDSDIDGVGSTTSAVSGQGNQNVLLDVEGAGVEGTGGEDAGQELSERVRQQLDNQGGNGHGAGTEPAKERKGKVFNCQKCCEKKSEWLKLLKRIRSRRGLTRIG
jgi:hypothetical protein